MISEQRYSRKREEKYKFEQRLFVALEERATRRYKNWFSFRTIQYRNMVMINQIVIPNFIEFYTFD